MNQSHSKLQSRVRACGRKVDGEGFLCFSSTRDSIASGYLNTEKRVENTTRRVVFLTKLEVFEYSMEHCLECFENLLNRNKN